jgi:hypothetical protein
MEPFSRTVAVPPKDNRLCGFLGTNETPCPFELRAAFSPQTVDNRQMSDGLTPSFDWNHVIAFHFPGPPTTRLGNDAAVFYRLAQLSHLEEKFCTKTALSDDYSACFSTKQQPLSKPLPKAKTLQNFLDFSLSPNRPRRFPVTFFELIFVLSYYHLIILKVGILLCSLS